MRIVLAGGSGLLGRALTSRLVAAGHEVTVLSRRDRQGGPGVRFVEWPADGSAPAGAPWVSAIDGAGAIINLAGEGIADKRWNDARKAQLRASRVLSTRSLVSAVRAAAQRPPLFIQGSAIGFYGPGGDAPVDETSPPGDDFLGRLCNDWESEARPVETLVARTVYVRTAIVLTPDGGALKELMFPFKLFGGGPLGSGQQYWSWIHLEDWIRLMIWAIDSPEVHGPINGSSPEPVRNEALARAIGTAMHRPSWFRVPAFVLKIVVGEMADAELLGSKRVLPRRTQDLGFTFRHPQIDEAVASLLSAR